MRALPASSARGGVRGVSQPCCSTLTMQLARSGGLQLRTSTHCGHHGMASAGAAIISGRMMRRQRRTLSSLCPPAAAAVEGDTRSCLAMAM